MHGPADTFAPSLAAVRGPCTSFAGPVPRAPCGETRRACGSEPVPSSVERRLNSWKVVHGWKTSPGGNFTCRGVNSFACTTRTCVRTFHLVGGDHPRLAVLATSC